MKRSVIQLAGRTLLVSLPAKWAAAQNVKKGDELDLVEDGHKMIINTQPKAVLESASIDADAVGALIQRYIFALYKKGVDEIKIKFNDPKVPDMIRDTLLNETVGYEIVSQTPTSCEIKLITSGNLSEFDNLLRRIFLLLLSMAEETLTAVKNKDFSHLEKTAQLEEPNNRLTTVCRRSLNKWGTDKFNKVGPIYYIIEDLENVADEYKYLCMKLTELKKSKDKSIKPEVLSLLEKTNETLRLFYESFYKFEPDKFNKIMNVRKQLVKDAHKLIESKKLNAMEFYILHHSLVITQKIFCMTGPFLVLTN